MSSTPKTYTGPSVPTMIQSKSLAENIIKYHNHPTSDSILDDANLDLLQRFVNEPGRREELLREQGIDPEESLEGKEASLAAYVVWAHGRGDMDGGMLKEGDMEMLRGWFEGGRV